MNSINNPRKNVQRREVIERYMQRTKEAQEDPLQSIAHTLAFGLDTWDDEPGHAWVFGIVAGWNDRAVEELAMKFGWTQEQIDRLDVLYNKFQELLGE